MKNILLSSAYALGLVLVASQSQAGEIRPCDADTTRTFDMAIRLQIGMGFYKNQVKNPIALSPDEVTQVELAFTEEQMNSIGYSGSYRSEFTFVSQCDLMEDGTEEWAVAVTRTDWASEVLSRQSTTHVYSRFKPGYKNLYTFKSKVQGSPWNYRIYLSIAE